MPVLNWGGSTPQGILHKKASVSGECDPQDRMRSENVRKTIKGGPHGKPWKTTTDFFVLEFASDPAEELFEACFQIPRDVETLAREQRAWRRSITPRKKPK